MKLRNIYVLCRDNCVFIRQIERETVVINSRSVSRISGWGQAADAIANLMTVSIFRDKIETLIESVPAYYRTQNTFDIATEDGNKIVRARDNILAIMNNVMEIYEEIGQEKEKKVGLDIKLPEFTDFSEFAKDIGEIEYVLTKCPFTQSAEEELKFENVDVGTTWLTFFIAGAALTGGSILLNNIAAFVDKCIIIRSHYLLTEKQKNDLEKEKKEAKEKEIILKYIDKMYRKEVDDAIAELEEVTTYRVVDLDERDRIRLAMEKMGALIDKGLQIYSTIDSPSEVKNMFAPLEMKYIEIGKKMELLEEKADS